MKNQTLSIKRMRHLKDLGVGTSNASMRWINSKEDVPMPKYPFLYDGDYYLSMQCMEANKILSYIDIVPAFTLQDIINMLPEDVPCKYARYPLGKACLELGKDYAGYSYTDMNDEHDYEVCFGGHEDILVEVYNLLCWCAENGYLNNNQTK